MPATKPTTPPANPADRIVTAGEASALFGMGERWLRLRASEGWFAPVSRGRYRLGDVCAGVARFLEDQHRRAMQPSAVTEASLARTELAKIQAAQRMARLIPLDDAQAIVTEVAGLFAAELAALPARIPANATTRHAIRAAAKEAARRIDWHADEGLRQLMR